MKQILSALVENRSGVLARCLPAGHLLRPEKNVAHPAVGAAGHHPLARLPLHGQGGVVGEEIPHPAFPVPPLGQGAGRLKGGAPGNLPQEDHMGREGHRIPRQHQPAPVFHLLTGEGAAHRMAAAPLGLQGIRMADHPPLPPGKGAEEGGQAAGVVVVAVGEGDGPHLGQVDAHGGGVLQ